MSERAQSGVRRELSQKQYFRLFLYRFGRDHLSLIIRVALAAILTIFLLTLLAVTAAIFDAPSVDVDQYTMFISAFTVAVGFWLSGNSFFNNQVFDNFDFIALGVTLLIILILYALVKSLPQRPFWAVVSSSITYAGLVYLIYAFQSNDGRIDLLPHLVFPFLLAFVAVGMANYDVSVFTKLRNLLRTNERGQQVPKYVILSLRGSIAFIALLLIISAVLFIVGQFLNIESTDEILTALNVGPWAGITISLFSLAFLPNLVVYTMSLLFSDGFFFGDAAQISLSANTDQQSIPPFPLINGDISLSQLQISPELPFLTVFTIGALIAFWQTRKLDNDTLFAAWDKKRLALSELAYLLITQLITIVLVFIATIFLGYVSSGRIGDKIGYIGVDKIILAVDLLRPFALGCLTILVGFAIYKAYHIFLDDGENKQTNVILKEEVKKITHESMRDDEEKIRKNERGSRSASSTK